MNCDDYDDPQVNRPADVCGFDPTAIAEVAQEARLSPTALAFLRNISNPLMLHLPSTDLAKYDKQMFEMVQWATHCGNTFLDVCGCLNERMAFASVPVHKALLH